jgi:hypothetical protein
MLKRLFTLVIILSSLSLSSQILYPIQTTLRVANPFSPYLQDYIDAADDRLQVILTYNDIVQPPIDVVLKWEIVRNNDFNDPVMVTPGFYPAGPQTITAGVPYLISGLELQNHIGVNALDFVGYSKQLYLQKKVLPDGFYTIAVTAYKADNRNIQVSNRAMYMAYFAQYDSPILTNPICNSTIASNPTQFFMMNWMNLQPITPGSFNPPEYRLQMCVLPDSLNMGLNPNLIIDNPSFRVLDITTTDAFYNYSNSNFPLQEGGRYAWRVQVSDPAGKDLYKNQGFSPVCTFTYGNKNTVLGNALNLTLQGVAENHKTIALNWNASSLYTGYQVLTNQKNDTNLFTTDVDTNFFRASPVAQNRTFQFRVKGKLAEGGFGPESNQIEVTTPSQASVACNDTFVVRPPGNSNAPLLFPAIGQLWQIGQFEIKVISYIPLPQPGHYQGKGSIRIQFMGNANFEVVFDDIFVTDEYDVKGGHAYIPSDGLDSYLNSTFNDANANYVDGTAVNATLTGNTVVITFLDGPTQSFTMPNDGSPLVIRDENGNQFIIGANGQVQQGVYYTFSNDKLDNSATKDFQVQFSNDSIQHPFGFDRMSIPQWYKDYEIIQLSDKTAYKVPYISISKSAPLQAKVKASFKTTGTIHPVITFSTSTGVNIPTTRIGTTDNYNLSFSYSSLNTAIYAKADGKKIGKLNIIALDQKNSKVIIVPVNNASISNSSSSTLQTSLNDIYQQANSKWTVSIKPNFTIAFDSNSNGLDVSDATLMSKYSSEMKAIRDAYKTANPTYDKTAYYLFVVPSFSDPTQLGYMVRGKGIGFVTPFGSAQDFIKTIAHELGHGAFGLEHTFGGDNNIPQNSTDNLLDYGTGEKLSRKQWEKVHSVLPVISWLDDEEDGSFADRYIITPDFKLSYIDNVNILYSGFDHSLINDGTLPGFTKVVNGVEKDYKWNYVFKKYENIADANDVIVPQTITNLDSKRKVMLLYGWQTSCHTKYIDISVTDHNAAGTMNANVLLGLINSNTQKAKAINCLGSVATITSKEWIEKNRSLNCAIANTQSAIASNLANITSSITSNTNAPTANTVLKNNYSTCVFESLDFSTRMMLLDIFLKSNVAESDWEFSDGLFSLNDRFFIGNLVLSTPVAERKRLLKEGFMDNPTWLKVIWDAVKNTAANIDVTIETVSPMLSEMSNWAMTYYSDLNLTIASDQLILDEINGVQAESVPKAALYPLFLGNTSDHFKFNINDGFENTLTSTNLTVGNNDIAFIQTRSRKPSGPTISASGSNLNTTVQYNQSFHPFEPVKLILGNNYSFLDLGSNYAPNKEMVVPAILAALYIQKIRSNATQHNLRQVGNVAAITAAIAAAPLTGGGSLAAWTANVAVVGGITATADINIQNLKQQLITANTYNQYQTYFEGWDYFYNTVAVGEGILGGIQLSILAKNINYTKAWNGFNNRIKNLADGSAVELIKARWRAVKVLPLNNVGKVLTSKPSWLPNRILQGDLTKPKGLIGVYNKEISQGNFISDTKNMLQELNYPLCNSSNFSNVSQDGFKMLNVPNDAADMWVTYNKPWIEALTNGKADLVVLSNKADDLMKFQLNPDFSFKTINGQRIKSGFGKEIDFMENLVQQGKYQWDGVNGVYKYTGN